MVASVHTALQCTYVGIGTLRRASHDCVLRQLLYRRFPPTFSKAKTTAILWRGCKFAGKKFIFPATVGRAALCGANR